LQGLRTLLTTMLGKRHGHFFWKVGRVLGNFSDFLEGSHLRWLI
jgi:hypothetical protein